MTYGQYMRELRHKRNISQTQLGKIISTSKQYISAVERDVQLFSAVVEGRIIKELKLSKTEIVRLCTLRSKRQADRHKKILFRA